MLTLSMLALVFLLYSLVSRRMDSLWVSAPMLFFACGALLGDAGLGWLDTGLERDWLHHLAELTLALLLFSDATRIQLRSLRREQFLPSRLLMLGLPLTILLGGLVAWLLPLGLEIWQALLLGALLAPTDAALGQSIVDSEEVPVGVRQTINVESGLNDGIALPFVLLFASLASGESPGGLSWAAWVAKQLFFAVFVGLAVASFSAALLNRARAAKWLSTEAEGIAALATALLVYALATQLGGNGFVAVFAGGLVFGAHLSQPSRFLHRFTATEGRILMLSTFFLVAATLLASAFESLSLWVLLYALLSLTLIRMLPVRLSLMGIRLHRATPWLLGWFGPRGLASVVFLLLIMDSYPGVVSDVVVSATLLTVSVSIYLHGISATPLVHSYAGYVRNRHSHPEQHENKRWSDFLPSRHLWKDRNASR